MHRTTILLPEDLRRRAETVAATRGLSLSELIRRQLEKVAGPASKPSSRRDDPLFKKLKPSSKATPRDLAANHDHYLYGEA
ncbi:ribbon-helix-helix domain-containing protein [Chthoniobacter flavus]|uniref:ribbon-helix-helix domain-containing protein n=1 Tax=Chthoniobacter flavus TaxID=191863 RepID=UPI001046AAEB|nr:CopG family transcriptional regulator [Chthoniobacter flavus]